MRVITGVVVSPYMRVGFLFNHDQIHQIAHSLPIAVALACLRPDLSIVVATSNLRVHAEVLRLLGPKIGSNIEIVQLAVRSAPRRTMVALVGKLVPIAKLLLFADNLDFFRSLDALVVTERTSLVLKSRFGLVKPKLFLADHGAGDRAIGFGSSASHFDHILAAGPKIRDRMTGEAGVAPERISVTGYPKFDLPVAKARPFKFRDSKKPIVLYNPHLSPHLSSWYRDGRAILDFFAASEDYNLIFAPHIMMFERRFNFTIDRWRMARPGQLARRHIASRNIHIDIASRALTDMSYVDCADIYLGDASSQLYEFLRKPRPCIFFNSHRHSYRGDPNFAHWNAGQVIESVASLGGALSQAQAQQAESYGGIQKELFGYTFDLGTEPSSARAASVIAKLVG